MRKSIHRPEHAVLTNLLREYRLKRGLTQVALSNTLNMPQSFVSDVETGQRRLDLVQLRDLCSALGISLVKFVSEFDRRLRIP